MAVRLAVPMVLLALCMAMHMVLLLVVLIYKSYGSHVQIFLVSVPSVLRDEFYGAYGSLA